MIAIEDPRIALFDLDGSLANYVKKLYKELELLRGPNESTADDYNDNLPHIAARQLLIKNTPGFWLNLERIEAGFKVFDLVKSVGYKQHVLTRAPRVGINAWSEKAQWCEINLPNVDVTVTKGSKGLTYGRVLFDDWPPYMLDWLQHRPRGLGIMLSQPWNVGFTHPNVIIIDQNNLEDSLDKLLPLLISNFNRK